MYDVFRVKNLRFNCSLIFCLVLTLLTDTMVRCDDNSLICNFNLLSSHLHVFLHLFHAEDQK